MVPVGGAVIAGPDKKLIQEISASYPGRASAAQSTDVFITLLSMGVRGYKQLLATRKQLFTSLVQQLEVMETRYPVRVMRSKNNTISVAISLQVEREAEEERAAGGQLTQVGSMLFTRGVSGTRVVTGEKTRLCKVSWVLFVYLWMGVNTIFL